MSNLCLKVKLGPCLILLIDWKYIFSLQGCVTVYSDNMSSWIWRCGADIKGQLSQVWGCPDTRNIVLAISEVFLSHNLMFYWTIIVKMVSTQTSEWDKCGIFHACYNSMECVTIRLLLRASFVTMVLRWSCYQPHVFHGRLLSNLLLYQHISVCPCYYMNSLFFKNCIYSWWNCLNNVCFYGLSRILKPSLYSCELSWITFLLLTNWLKFVKVNSHVCFVFCYLE